MTAAIIAPTRLRHGVRIGLAALAISAFTALGNPAQARGPEGIADVAEKVIDAVVNISTSQTVEAKGGSNSMPQLPPGSPFEEFFDDFFKNRRGPGGGSKGGDNNSGPPRKTNSLGSGFIIDTSGVVVTNNHVIADADQLGLDLGAVVEDDVDLIGIRDDVVVGDDDA